MGRRLSKNIPRTNLPPKARVAWNVAFRQLLLARTTADSLTDYTSRMAILVHRTEKVFRSFSEKWIKGKRISNANALDSEINSILEAVNALSYATPERTPSTMTEPNHAGDDDTLGSVLTSVLGNLVGRLSNLDTAKPPLPLLDPFTARLANIASPRFGEQPLRHRLTSFPGYQNALTTFRASCTKWRTTADRKPYNQSSRRQRRRAWETASGLQRGFAACAPTGASNATCADLRMRSLTGAGERTACPVPSANPTALTGRPGR